MHLPHQQAHAALLRVAACLWLFATGLAAQAPAPATPVKPGTPPSIPRPVLPPGLQRPGITNPNTVPPAVPGGINRPGLPAGAAGGPQPVSSTAAPPKSPAATTPPPVPPALPTNTTAAPPASTSSTPKPPPIPGNSSTPTKPGEKAPNLIAFDAETIDVVLEEYYRVTKRRVLKDRGLEATTVTIMVPGEFTDEEYQDIIEKGLLMHGLALVPSGTNLWKLVAAETGSSPGQQQLPMVLDAEKLPETDQVVIHVTTLKYLAAEEAANTLQSAIPPHPYGKIVAVPNARSLVITEASQTIRAYLDLIKHLDLPPSLTMQKTIKLIRTDPEDVAKQLESLLDLKNTGGSTGSSSTNRPATPATAPRAPAIPGIPQQAAQPAAAAAPVVSASGGGATSEGAKPIILPLTRTSSLLVIARPQDIELIEKLVGEIDAEATANRFVSRRLNYIDLTTFLGLAEKALMSYDKNATGSTSTTTGQNSNTSNTNTNSSFNNFGNSGFGGNSFGSNSFGGGFGGGLGGGGGSGFGSGGGGPKLDVTTKANSVLIGRTLVIIDPGSSKFFASGPPEQLQTLEDLADELDVRPRQIMISAIIGRFRLSDDFRFGLDWINSLKSLGGDKLIGGVGDGGAGAFDPTDLNNFATLAAKGGLSTLGGLAAYGQVTKNLSIFMNAVETSGRFKVLQKPVVTTLNHQSASIYIGEQIAIAGQSFNSGVVGGGFSSTTQYIPIRLQLDITPHIFNDQEVMLEFKQQNNSKNGTSTVNGNEVPNISEQGMSNALIVPDRTVAMLGGLISEENDNPKSGIPFLVRLPLIKYLFGNTARSQSRSELMIFVQPHILPDGAAHINEQTRLFNNSQNSNDVFEFAGYPEEPLAPAPNFYAKDKPRVQTDVDATPVPEPEKRGLWDKFKGIFKKQPKE